MNFRPDISDPLFCSRIDYLRKMDSKNFLTLSCPYCGFPISENTCYDESHGTYRNGMYFKDLAKSRQDWREHCCAECNLMLEGLFLWYDKQQEKPPEDSTFIWFSPGQLKKMKVGVMLEYTSENRVRNIRLEYYRANGTSLS